MTPYGQFTVQNQRFYSRIGFWIMYRAKQDGAALLGLRHPWEGHEDHTDGGHEH
ncbi:hypothetical protein AMTRI_Chr09g35770 [Amborella trichopoda]